MHDPRRPEPRKKGCFLWRLTKKLVKLAVIAVVLGVPSAYFGLPVLAKSDWARARVERALTNAAGTPVQIGRMELSWRQGLILSDVTVDGAVTGLDMPAAVRQIVHSPCRTIVRGAEIAVNDADGLACPRLCRMLKHKIVIEDSTVHWNGVTVTDVAGTLGVEKSALEVRELRGRLNGGEVTAKGSGDVIEVRFEDADARVLSRLVPAFEGAVVSGPAELKIVRGENMRGELTFEGRLTGGRMMIALASATQESRLASMEFTRVKANLQFADGRVTNLGTELRAEKGAARLTGWVGGGEMDMLMVFDHDLVHELKGRAEAYLIEGVQIVGSPSQPSVLLE